MKSKFLSVSIAGILSIMASIAQAGVPCNATDMSVLPVKLTGYAKINLQTALISLEVPSPDKVTRCAVSPLEYGDLISFTFAEGHEAIATITVDAPMSFRQITRQFKLSHLGVYPTVLASEREIYPHSIRVNDTLGKMIYDLYLDHSGQVAFTRAYSKQK